MDPINSLADYATGKLMDVMVDRFHKDIIQRWIKYRAQNFFESFCEEVSKELISSERSDNVDVLLDMILENDTRSEILFDSYRRTYMARSKNLGPRIIGILTAKLVASESIADETEELIFMAAEQLNDDELLAFSSFYEENRKAADSQTKNQDIRRNKDGSLEIKWDEENIDSNWNRDSNISLSPLNLGECLGAWALKLKSLGFITDDVREKQWDYAEDSERYIDQNGTMRVISWLIQIPSSSIQLVNLINRVSPRNSA